MGSDVLTQAKSGMGKTAIFVLSVLNRMETKPEPITTLVMGHTHELAYQIKKEFARFSKYMPDIKTEVVYGGESIFDQEKMLKTAPPHILVATPGRLLALLRKKVLKLDKVKFFILDECDKMLQQLGILRITYCRYERRCSKDLHGNSPREASYDVLSNTSKGDPSCLPKVHASSI
eukprot:TRINITY_DN3199_c0_g1_i4.p2 TRINITY_DN3199_c0_g1~~TRINITY_DN3199_c0_g1_i4.p2  ORF type:complete len:176 (+),score=32.39 TRINITY_DN3199_c0_g1_i4:345-872(+)